jgi:hypothetical protein
MNRLFTVLVALVLGLALVPAAAATDNQKWFVCKYETTPGGVERLQTGNNPISVSESAIPIHPVVVGASFADAQGRSYVLAEDIGQPEPSPTDCPPPNPPPTPSPTLPPPTPSPTPPPTPSPPPSPTPSAAPSQTPATSPSATPTAPPQVGTFTVETCPAGVPVPFGESAIRLRGALLLIILLNVRVDGHLITLTDALGDGTVGDAFVTPGVHHITISNAADTEVIAETTVDCPECNPATPGKTAPPTDTIMSTDRPTGGGILPAFLLIVLIAGAAMFLIPARSKR